MPYESRYSVTAFTVPGLSPYTIPPWAVTVEVIIQAPGGPGASGGRGAAGTLRPGGGGGQAGGYTQAIFDVLDLPATLDVFLDAPEDGGTSVVTDDTAGVDGSSTGSPQASYVTSPGAGWAGAFCGATRGNPGKGNGNRGAALAGVGGQGTYTGAQGGSSPGPGGHDGEQPLNSPRNAGGGGGGAITTANVRGDGGDGVAVGWLTAHTLGGEVTPGSHSIHGEDYTGARLVHSYTPNSPAAGLGGAGGAAVLGADAGHGGVGGPGCGGGGGGASENGWASGSGGRGGPGQIWLIARG